MKYNSNNNINNINNNNNKGSLFSNKFHKKFVKNIRHGLDRLSVV